MPESARLIDLPAMDAGAPMPTVLWGIRQYLLYFAPESPTAENVVILEFDRGLAIKYGPPSDETLMNHRLWGKGLGFYASHEVLDSDWLKELELMDAHRSSPGWLRAYKHYLFTFHDEAVECLAMGCSWRLRSGGMVEAVQELAGQI